MESYKLVDFSFSQEAVFYTWRQLAQRAGVAFSNDAVSGFEATGIPVFYGEPEQVQFQSPGLIICRCADSAWGAILNASDNSLRWKPAKETIPAGTRLPFDNPIPVLFWGRGYDDGCGAFAECRADGSIIFHADILASSFFMLSRWEETVLPAYDEHERFLGAKSVAYRQGFLNLPVVDQYAIILRIWLKTLLPTWQPAARSFSVKLSHDIDHICTFNSVLDLGMRIGGDVVFRRSLRKVLGTVKTGVKDWLAPTANPAYQGIIELAEASRQNGLNSAFYFKASNRSRFDSGYHLERRWVKTIISMLQDRGFEIGFHPGYTTFNDPDMLMKEKRRFDRLVGALKYGGRQHYLRFKIPDTWAHWEQAGFAYDSSMIFPDKNGFRCGTCHPFTPFDVHTGLPFYVWEIPLVMMDRILLKEGLSPQDGRTQILGFAQKCLEVEGVFTLLWHNTSLDGPWAPWYEMYKGVLPELAAMQGYVSETP